MLLKKNRVATHLLAAIGLSTLVLGCGGSGEAVEAPSDVNPGEVHLPVKSGVRLAGGDLGTLVVTPAGYLRASGNNSYGQLGDGTTTHRYSPVTAVGLSGVVAASSGVTHSLALINDGTVRSWGGNNVGQLGTGTTTGRLSAGTVPGLTGVVAIAAGRLHSLAARSDGTVWTWGNNAQGTLGNGTTVANSLSPVQALNLTGVTDVAAGVGGNSVAALRNDGTVWTWGDNSSGQLGDGTLTQRNAPVKVLNLTGVTAIATANAHMVALRNDGTVWTWGYNASGQLGNGTTSAYSTTPVRVAGLTGVVRIAAGAHHTLALRNDGTVWGWGSNSYGQTDCSFVASPTPVKVSSLTGVVEISAGTFHSLARKSDGTIWAWGHNSYGQLGDSGSFRCEPTRWND